jgi:APA family basic amino acid/polyamine antiporter
VANTDYFGEYSHPNTDCHLKNKIGFWTATSLVVGNMIGAGIYLLPSTLAAYGGISLLGWCLSGIGALFIAKVFSEISKLLPHTNGGPYAYTRAGFGDFAGFLVAWGYWISVWTTNAAIVISLVSALSGFFPILSREAMPAILTGLAVLWLLTWVNTRGIRASGKVQLVTTILKILPLAALLLTGIFRIQKANFIPFNASGGSAFHAIGITATLTLFAFLGIECATIPAGSSENPERNVPRATMVGTVFTIFIYIISMAVIMGILPPAALRQSVTPFADAGMKLWGPRAGEWIGAGVAVAAFGALNGWILVQGQIPAAIAKDRLFPGIFSRENRRGAPATGVLVSSVLVSLFLAMNYTRGLAEQFKFFLLLSTLCTLVPYLLVAAAYVIVVARRRPAPGRVEWIKVLALSVPAFIFSLLAIIGAGEEIAYWGLVLLLAGTPIYVWNVWRGQRTVADTGKLPPNHEKMSDEEIIKPGPE